MSEILDKQSLLNLLILKHSLILKEIEANQEKKRLNKSNLVFLHGVEMGLNLAVKEIEGGLSIPYELSEN